MKLQIAVSPLQLYEESQAGSQFSNEDALRFENGDRRAHLQHSGNERRNEEDENIKEPSIPDVEGPVPTTRIPGGGSTCRGLLDPPRPAINFRSKQRFSGKKEYLVKRSNGFKLPLLTHNTTVWDIKPPDMNPHAFDPINTVKEYNRHWRCPKVESYRLPQQPIAQVFDSVVESKPRHVHRPPSSKMITHLPVPTDVDLRHDVAINATLAVDHPYTNPVAHVFREEPKPKVFYPNLNSVAAKDPFDIKFRSERLPILHGSAAELKLRDIKGSELHHRVSPVDQLEIMTMTLPKSRYPQRPGSFCRHRRLKSPGTGWLDRLERRLAPTLQSRHSQRAAKRRHVTAQFGLDEGFITQSVPADMYLYMFHE